MMMMMKYSALCVTLFAVLAPAPANARPAAPEIVCSAEVKECLDKSFVSRSPPECGYDACPNEVKVDADHGTCPDMEVNTKCPYKHTDRLYRDVNQTIESCHEMCLDTEGCDYYSFAHPGHPSYAGVCMGCTADMYKQEHTGFNLYSVDCVGTTLTTTPPTEAPTEAPTATPKNGPTDPPKGSGSGDPHFKTWTGAKFDYHGECDLVLVDNPSFADGLGLRLHIRTTRVKYFSFIEKVALQIGNEVLEFDNDVEKFLINGTQVGEDRKHHKTLLSGYVVRRDPKAISVRLHKEDRLHKEGQAKIDFHTRTNGFPAVIVDAGHTDLFEGSLGLLGEYGSGIKLARDGKTEIKMNGADATAFALEWQVRDNEPMLFKDARAPQFPTTCTPPAQQRLGDSLFKAEAEEACAHWETDKEDCIFDVIATRDILVAEEGHIVHVE